MALIDAVKKSFRWTSSGEEGGNYDTVAGLVMYVLQGVPAEGDHFVEGGFKFEVVDMDGNRVDKVIVSVGGSGEK